MIVTLKTYTKTSGPISMSVCLYKKTLIKNDTEDTPLYVSPLCDPLKFSVSFFENF